MSPFQSLMFTRCHKKLTELPLFYDGTVLDIACIKQLGIIQKI